ncbi:MAG: hypothetical protein RIT27_434 [Pseudomonadota bacterium]|jgi:signal transduction histidine kinase/BarA-like signal transduction histidine kinase
MKLKTKLILILMPLSILPLLIFGNVVYQHLITTFRQEVLGRVHNTLEQTQQNMRSYLHSTHDQLRILASNEMLRDYLLTEPPLRYALLQSSILSLFSSYQRNNTDYKEINLLLPDGSEDSHLTKDKEVYFINKQTPSYFGAIKNSQSILTELFISEEESFFLLSYKLHLLDDYKAQNKNDNQSLRGYLNIVIQPNFLFNMVKNKILGKTGYLFLTNKQGHIVFQPVNQKLPTISAIKQAINLPEKAIRISHSDPFYIEGLKLNENLYVIAYLPEYEVLETGVFLQRTLIITAIVSAILTFILLYLLLHYLIVNPIYKLSLIARQLKTGNLSLDITPPSKDEIGYLYISFNYMVKNLRKMLNEVENTNETLERKIRERTADLEQANAALILARQDAEEANRIKSTFIANLSHEFRTPLNGILGMSEVISKVETDEELRQQVKIIYDCGNTLLVLIEELLDVAQLDAGSIILEHQPFDIRQTLRDSVNLVHTKAQQKGLKIQLHTAPLLPQYLVGDVQRLRQIILNLLLNAIKFTEQGEIIVRTDILEDNKEIVTFQINVIDTGMGISKEKQLLLFKYFNQIENITSRSYNGAGIGLFICHKIVSLMKGKIGVISELNQGSTFWIQLSLPIAIPEKKIETLKIQHKIAFQQPKHILVVEDDLTTQKFMQIMLEKIGFKVDTANNGRKALIMVEKNEYDLILMDIIMPIMDGYTTAKHLRKELSLEKLPIIAVSSLDFAKEQNKLKIVGINDFLAKPVTPTSLNNMLKKWLN